MSIRFILAPAGGGKTWHCLQEIAALEKADPLGTPVYFILPEQATFIMNDCYAKPARAAVFAVPAF